MSVVNDLFAEVAAQGEIDDILEEVASKNRVRVTVHRAASLDHWHRVIHKAAEEIEAAKPVVHLGQVLMQDELRMAAGKKSIYLGELFKRLFSTDTVAFAYNERTTIGIDYMSDALGKSSGRPAVAEYIALSSNTGALPQLGNTSATTPLWGTATSDGSSTGSTGEITGGGAAAGLQRAIASLYTHVSGTPSYRLDKTFTLTGAGPATAVQWCGMFNNSAQGSGLVFLQNKFTSTALATNDQLTIQWTVNV